MGEESQEESFRRRRIARERAAVRREDLRWFLDEVSRLFYRSESFRKHVAGLRKSNHLREVYRDFHPEDTVS